MGRHARPAQRSGPAAGHATPGPAGAVGAALHPTLRNARTTGAAPATIPAAVLQGGSARPLNAEASSGRGRRLRLVGLVIPILLILGGALGLAFADPGHQPTRLPSASDPGVGKGALGSVNSTPGDSASPGSPSLSSSPVRPSSPASESTPIATTIATLSHPTPGTEDPGASTTGGPPEWSSVLAELDRRRSLAFEEGRADVLNGVYAPGSAPLAADRAALDALRAQDAYATGLRMVIDDVRVLVDRPGGIVLRVVDRMPAYQIVDGSGRLVEARPGRGSASWVVELRSVDTDWRIWSIAPAEQ